LSFVIAFGARHQPSAVQFRRAHDRAPPAQAMAGRGS
jgi:hypothetical protein